ncbi:hypothetical protein BCR36DRAFT_402665 [Piromyces finnis]|uniref:Uncharacterized protein n=1 Tax=Piromyces finnis TaxID=1754191 RepID=A0A1Y1VGI2_9FUNG|nr:hypothetical protein BCR36DRAFT_402665 [Piromyces finnis]|eukprot:ORX55835.1 hypothetical protein BCR36DRAFT_402665 [Piromyces finnis]
MNRNNQSKNNEKIKTPSNKVSIAKKDSPFSTPLINELSEREAKIRLKEAYKELNECSENLKLAAEIGNQLLNEKIKIENLYQNALEKIKELSRENSNSLNELEDNSNYRHSQQYSQLLKQNVSQDDLKAVIKELDTVNTKNYNKIEKLKEEIRVYQLQLANSKAFYEEEISKYKNECQVISQKYKQIYNMKIDEITEITKELNIPEKRDDIIQKFKEHSQNNINVHENSTISNNIIEKGKGQYDANTMNNQEQFMNDHEHQQIQINKLKAKNAKLQSELKAAQLIRQTNNEKIEDLETKLNKYKKGMSALQIKNAQYADELIFLIHKFEPELKLENVKKELNLSDGKEIHHQKLDMDLKGQVDIPDTTLEIFKTIKSTILKEFFNKRNIIKTDRSIQTESVQHGITLNKDSPPEMISVETQTVVTLPEKIITPFSALYKKTSKEGHDKNKELTNFINIIREKNELLPLKNKNLINIPLYHDHKSKTFLNRNEKHYSFSKNRSSSFIESSDTKSFNKSMDIDFKYQVKNPTETPTKFEGSIQQQQQKNNKTVLDASIMEASINTQILKNKNNTDSSLVNLSSSKIESKIEIINNSSECQNECAINKKVTIDQPNKKDIKEKIDLDRNSESDANERIGLERNNEKDANEKIDLERNNEKDVNKKVKLDRNSESDANERIDLDRNSEKDANEKEKTDKNSNNKDFKKTNSNQLDKNDINEKVDIDQMKKDKDYEESKEKTKDDRMDIQVESEKLINNKNNTHQHLNHSKENHIPNSSFDKISNTPSEIAFEPFTNSNIQSTNTEREHIVDKITSSSNIVKIKTTTTMNTTIMTTTTTTTTTQIDEKEIRKSKKSVNKEKCIPNDSAANKEEAKTINESINNKYFKKDNNINQNSTEKDINKAIDNNNNNNNNNNNSSIISAVNSSNNNNSIILAVNNNNDGNNKTFETVNKKIDNYRDINSDTKTQNSDNKNSNTNKGGNVNSMNINEKSGYNRKRSSDTFLLKYDRPSYKRSRTSLYEYDSFSNSSIMKKENIDYLSGSLNYDGSFFKLRSIPSVYNKNFEKKEDSSNNDNNDHNNN